MLSPADREATCADLRRLGWVLLWVWAVLVGLTLILAPFLGWPLAVGLVGTTGVLFTVGVGVAAVLPLLVEWIRQRRDRRR